MKSLEELINAESPFVDTLNKWVSSASNQVTILPAHNDRQDILLNVQVTTKSILGCLVYHTGGILIDNGWIRLLGSGHEMLLRNVHDWNENSEKGIYLIGDDVAGGFYAINGGAFSGEHNIVYYWSPDSLEWESMDMLYSDFFHSLLNSNLDHFYDGIRWESWKKDMENISTDQCITFMPFLWTKEGDCENSHRGVIPIKEALDMKVDIINQMQE